MSDKELKRIAGQFVSGLLGKRESRNMCFMVSSALQGYLSVCGLETTIRNRLIFMNGAEWDHVWLELPDGRILDPTADQFDTPDGKKMPKIFIGQKPEWYLSKPIEVKQNTVKSIKENEVGNNTNQ